MCHDWQRLSRGGHIRQSLLAIIVSALMQTFSSKGAQWALHAVHRPHSCFSCRASIMCLPSPRLEPSWRSTHAISRILSITDSAHAASSACAELLQVGVQSGDRSQDFIRHKESMASNNMQHCCFETRWWTVRVKCLPAHSLPHLIVFRDLSCSRPQRIFPPSLQVATAVLKPAFSARTGPAVQHNSFARPTATCSLPLRRPAACAAYGPTLDMAEE